MRTHLLLVVAILFTATLKAQTLVAYYPFNGNANDASGNGNNGTVNGATLTTDRFGNPNSAYNFDGNDYIEVPRSVSLEPSTVSVTAWVNNTVAGGSQFPVVTKRYSDAGCPYNSYYLGGDCCTDPRHWAAAVDMSASCNPTFDPSNITTGPWKFLAMTYDGTTLKLYVNGALVSSAAYSGPILYRPFGPDPGNNYSLRIGHHDKISADGFIGAIDDVRIYAGALSQAQITAILPVRLINFTANKCGINVCLNWSTANEENVSHFEIERSRDGRTFENIATQSAQNASTARYNSSDRVSSGGVVYYRLKSVDKDGSFSYSRIVKLDFSKKVTVVISPNPAKNRIFIQGAENFRHIEILDAHGRLIKTLQPTLDNNFDVQFLKSGMYWIKLTGDGEVQTHKMIKE